MKEILEKLLLSQGSTWCKEVEFMEFLNKKKIHPKKLEDSIAQYEIIKRTIDGRNYYSLPSYHQKEVSIARHAKRVLQNSSFTNSDDALIEQYIQEGEQEHNITLHIQQKKAVICGVKNGLCVITGGPGTGKTSVLKVMIYVLEHLFFGVNIKFVAPTGKAARRISESTQWPAKTIQKELKMSREKMNPDKYSGDILIVDEISMLDTEVAHALFRAMKTGQKLILVGDVNQLPSVGPGAVLRDLILSEVIPYEMLTKTFRQDMNSNLFKNITQIKDGEYPLSNGYDFVIHEAESDVENQLLNLYINECKEYGVDNVALLLPYRKAGIICSNHMNIVIQKKMNPPNKKPFLKNSIFCFSEGDPVMQLDNRRECANGDVGKVIALTESSLTVKFIDCEVIYGEHELEQLALAYAISISKSQGSEYQSVVIGITEEHQAMLKRNVLYTGVTRAKKKCILLQEESACMKAIFTDGSYDRITFLAEELRDAI